MTGKELLDVLVTSSGLPKEFAETQLASLVHQSGLSVDSINIEEVRTLLTDLLQDLVLDCGEPS